jgi:hypothetical protein
MKQRNEYSEIYLLTSPSGKQYVGKANCINSKGRIHGTLGRWKDHIRDSRAADGGRCRLLNEEIRHHGSDVFNVQIIVTCYMNFTQYYERHFIKEYNTLYSINNKHGLNINEGGNSGVLSEETRKLMSDKRKQYIKKMPDSVNHKEETKKKISTSLIDNVIRYNYDGSVLPKYVKYVNWEDRKGYQIVSHPLCKVKNFVSSKLSLQELYEKCIVFLSDLK